MFHVKHSERVKDMIKRHRISDEVKIIEAITSLFGVEYDDAETAFLKMKIELEKKYANTSPATVDMLNPRDFMPTLAELAERGL